MTLDSPQYAVVAVATNAGAGSVAGTGGAATFAFFAGVPGDGGGKDAPCFPFPLDADPCAARRATRSAFSPLVLSPSAVRWSFSSLTVGIGGRGAVFCVCGSRRLSSREISSDFQ